MKRLFQTPDYNLNKLTRTEFKVYKELKKDPDFYRGKNITEISNDLYVSPASVIAMLKKIGFDGFSEFKISLNNFQKQTENNKSKNIVEQVSLEMNKTIDSIDHDELDKIVQKISKSKRIIILTSEQTYYVGKEFRYKLLMLNYDVILIKDRLLMKQTINRNKDDLIVVFSLFGNTSYIYENLRTYSEQKIVVTTNSKGILIGDNDLKLVGYYDGTERIKQIYREGCDIHPRITLTILSTIIIGNLLEENKEKNE